MKKLGLMAVLALGGLLLCNTAVMAQDTNSAPKEGKRGKGGFPTVEERMDRLNKELTLTDDQKPKVKAALEEQKKDMQGARDLPDTERRDKMRESFQGFDKKMKEILTPDQYTKFKEMPRGGGGKKGGKKSDSSTQ